MEILFSKEATRFLKKLSTKEAEKIREKLADLLNSIVETGVIPFNDLDIKNLKGDWQGFSRMRIGKVRVVFKVDAESDELQIYDIDFRGNIYKSLKLHTRYLSNEAEFIQSEPD
jgi:mRNA interferase RelE/StbE